MDGGGPSETAGRSLDPMHTTSHTLLRAIHDRADSRSWEEFHGRYAPLVYSVARRQRLDPEECEEVVQQVMLSLARRIESYDRERGTFRRWLMAITFNGIRDVANRRKRERRLLVSDAVDALDRAESAESSGSEPSAAAEAEAMWDRDWSMHLLREAIEIVRRKRSDLAFQAFWLLAIRDMPAENVASLLGIEKSHLYVHKHRIARHVAKEYAALQRASLDDEGVSS